MPTDVIMPQMGESIFEGTITKWLKQPGEKVQRDEPLFEISTDKVDAEIPAPASGTLQDIKVQAGATVQVNTVVGTIAAEGEAAGAAAPSPAPTCQAGRRGRWSKAAPSEAQTRRRRSAKSQASRISQQILRRTRRKAWNGRRKAKSLEYPEAGEQERVRSSPLVRRIAKDNNVDLTKVSGTGLGGRITKEDIEAFVARHGAGATAPHRRAVGSGPGYTAPAASARLPASSGRSHRCSPWAESRPAKSCRCRSCARRSPSTW